VFLKKLCSKKIRVFGCHRNNIHNYTAGNFFEGVDKCAGLLYNQYSIQLIIGTDLYPLENAETNTKGANSRVSWKSALAHEIIGHRETILKGLAQKNVLLDEVQASIRAAKFAPDLSVSERMTLLRDAICRLNHDDFSINEVRDILHIKER
jgi:hypothetical protein